MKNHNLDKKFHLNLNKLDKIYGIQNKNLDKENIFMGNFLRIHFNVNKCMRN
jgi:hypothetical protein